MILPERLGRPVLRIGAALVALLLGVQPLAAQQAAAPTPATLAGGEASPAPAAPETGSGPGSAPESHSGSGSGSTADHSKFRSLKGPFASGPEVTRACLACHTEAGNQVMHSLHWTWKFDADRTGQTLGKRTLLNSFCGNVSGNEARCTSCHTGYGWTDVRQEPPSDPAAVDCLACHDRSGQYTKLDNAAGHPPLDPVPAGATTITGAKAVAVDLAKAAASVGRPGIENCGSCHFYGGGGDNVKHGDLSSALVQATVATDVHMSKDGAGLVCVDCHVSRSHQVSGSRYDVMAEAPHGLKPGQRRDVATCQSCHGDTPHAATPIGWQLNDHTDRVACQTCHIPEIARGGVATKTWWDWSTAGKLKDGKPYHDEDFIQSDGKALHTYLSTKGDFRWEENVTPHYAWFDGQVRYTTGDDKIDPSAPVEINKVTGSPDDPHSRIWPFKRMAGRQAYDTELNELVHTHVYGPATETAFWTNFDWAKSIEAAMAYLGEPYSGKFDFADTVMYWPATHMVAPADQALGCAECHARNGRMAGVEGTYIPAAVLQPAGKLGMLMVALALAGVLGHGLLRLLGRLRRKAHG
ncbi:tetrathionate reductase family octaheme c-type cytochrome [Stappia sp. P2PMeth1]|uniref:tetrathionate reductase family octaheme c-type cytochrome n=1 Tax=Stappia sp. P2PMeth1 TaxID=2003586 RepID=UPI0016486D71|nr:tetrathionate reductase family octaheme c-type cytochrome [Stappia sp. P2PMeth1]